MPHQSDFKEMFMAEVTLPAEGQPKLTRRELLNYAWLASLGILLVDVAGIGFLFSMPRFKEGEFGGVFTLGPVSVLPPVDAPPVNYPKVKFWLTRSEQGITALYKVCTHLNFSMTALTSEGQRRAPWIASSSRLSPLMVRSWPRPTRKPVGQYPSQMILTSPSG
jgi:hypothetical protein